MKISKMIEKLQSIQDKYGDLQIYSADGDRFHNRAHIKSSCITVSKHSNRYRGQKCIELEFNGF